MPFGRSPVLRGTPVLVAAAGFIILVAATTPLEGQQRANRATAETSTVVVPSPRYSAGWIHRRLFGQRYRDLWATSIRVDILDLTAYGEGLTPFKTGGFGQSINLHFRGGDGRRYVFRSLDKSLRLPEEFRGTFVEEEFQDMKVSAFHPAAALIVAPLLEAAGILHANPDLVVLPDAPALGEFRTEFAGLLGTIEERPNEGEEDSPGFAGSQKVVSTEVLVERLEESSAHRVDARDYLKARLMDVWFGDRDRHMGQWRWARFDDGDGYVWRPIPRDRDEAFVANDGLIWWSARLFWPRFASFRDRYPGIRGLTENGWELDELILPALERPAWEAIADTLQRVLTDSVIAAAVRRMPPEMYRLNGPDLERALRMRRDRLDEKAVEFYELLAKEVDIRATDQPEVAIVRSTADGELEVRIHRTDPSGEVVHAPYYQRRFDAAETDEIRIYLHGGNDRALIDVSRQTDIRVRVIGGGGDDDLVDSVRIDGLEVDFYDDRGTNRLVAGRNTSAHTGSYTRPLSPDPIREYLVDWGQTIQPKFILSSNADNPIIVGGGFVRYRHGFRKAPYQSRTRVRVAASSSGRFLLEYASEFPEITPRVSVTLHAFMTGLERVRYHGIGNETVRFSGSGIHRVTQYRYLVDPSLALSLGQKVQLSLGPVFKLTSTADEPGRLVTDSLYGSGLFGQAGAQAAFRADFRDRSVWTRRGARLNVGASVFPALLDVNSVFGEIHGEARTFASLSVPTDPTLALRVGGKKIWGPVPYQEAAYIGGGGTIRGFDRQRFGGDASVYGNAELRFALAKLSVLKFPTEFGVFGLFDAGRVYVEGDSPGGWHTAGGGGVWAAPFKRDYTMSFAIAHSAEQTVLYFRAGFVL